MAQKTDQPASFVLFAFLIMCGTILLCVSAVEGNQDHSALTVVESADDKTDNDEAYVSVEGEEADNIPASKGTTMEDFVPTDDWQEVKDGQKLPPGLHVEMDFKTGRKRAKRMEKKKTPKITVWDAGDQLGVINTERPRYTRDQLKAALKDFKFQDVTPEEEENKKKVKENFRSYEELKKAMKDMKIAVKTEGEIVRELTNKLNQSTEDTEQLQTVLIDLEYYLHQIDNAQLFCDLGGLTLMLKLINSSEEAIRGSTYHVLGAALQSNTKAQSIALESGVLNHLIRGLVTDPSKTVQKKILYALSTLVRQFPFAQQRFLEEGGLTALGKLFKQADSKMIQIKIITLLTDLLAESDSHKEVLSSTNAVEAQRAEQYKSIHLRQAMTTTGWCQLMSSLLPPSEGEGTEHDSVEKVLQAMSALAQVCADHFSGTRPTLQALMLTYSKLAEQEEDGDDFFSSIHSSLKNLVALIYRDDL